MREIKFRAWIGRYMYYTDENFNFKSIGRPVTRIWPFTTVVKKSDNVMQYCKSNFKMS